MGIPTGESGCRRPKDANPAGDPPRRARARKGEATMNSRLYKVRKVLKMSQVEFGREIGVPGIPCTPGLADRGDGRDVPMG